MLSAAMISPSAQLPTFFNIMQPKPVFILFFAVVHRIFDPTQRGSVVIFLLLLVYKTETEINNWWWCLSYYVEHGQAISGVDEGKHTHQL